jgi:hypothetical protein
MSMDNEERQGRSCDPDNLLCQLRILDHLEGLEQQLGNEAFQEQFPEAAPLAERIREKLTDQEMVVEEGLAACSQPEPEPEPEPEEIEETSAEEPAYDEGEDREE